MLVKGGGLAAQSEAVAMGIGRALVEWERSETEIRAEKGKVEGTGEEWRDILKKGELFSLFYAFSALIFLLTGSH